MIIQGGDSTAVAGWANEQWRRVNDELLQKRRIWTECILAYNSKHGTGLSEVSNYRSRRYLPLSFQAVEAIAAHLTQGVMPHDEWFNVEGRTPDDDASAKYMSALMKWQHFRTGWRTEMAKILKQACIFGNVPWAVIWETDRRLVPDREQHAEALGAHAANLQLGQPTSTPGLQQKAIRKYDGPRLVCGDIFNFAKDRHSNEDGYALTMVRYARTKEYLKEMSIPDPMTGWAMYENTDGLSEQNTFLEPVDSMRREVETLMGIRDIPKDMVEVIEFWGDIPMDGQLFRNHVLVLANRTTVLRFEPNPYSHGRIPWNLFTLCPEPNQVYGKGILEPVLSLQDVANVRMNQVIDANSLVVNPMLKVRNTGVIDFENFISAPGALHLVNDPDDITPLIIPNQSSLGMQEIGFVSSQFNSATGAMNAFSSQDYQKSATEVGAVAGMVNSRFAESIKHIEQTFVLPALEMQIELNQSLMDESIWIRVVEPGPSQKTDPLTGMPVSYDPVGPAQMRISPDDIRGELDIYPIGASWVSNNQQQIGSMIQATQIIAQSPAQGVIKWNKFAKVLYQKMGVSEAYEFIKSDAEIAYEQQQQAMAMQAQQQMGGPGGPPNAGGPQGPSGGGGAQSMAGAPGTPPGGGAGQGPVQQTNGGPQRGGA